MTRQALHHPHAPGISEQVRQAAYAELFWNSFENSLTCIPGLLYVKNGHASCLPPHYMTYLLS